MADKEDEVIIDEEDNETLISNEEDEEDEEDEDEEDEESGSVQLIDDDEIEDEEDEEKIKEDDIDDLTSIKTGLSYKNSFILNDDLEANDSTEFLQKFDKESKNNFIAINHQECFSKNLDEIKELLKVIKNKDNIIIDELHKTLPILTKYERTRILGIRLKQLNNGSLPYIKVDENILDNFLIAEKELKEKKLPFIIQRPIPNNTFEYWKLQDLEIL
tara:strand:- start:780 stop:1430 length:651 start_codon:yes stop_codon:yes gene_type:complete